MFNLCFYNKQKMQKKNKDAKDKKKGDTQEFNSLQPMEERCEETKALFSE